MLPGPYHLIHKLQVLFTAKNVNNISVGIYLSETIGYKIVNSTCKGEKCIGPLAPENFEVSRKYFKPPFVCEIFQVNLHMGFLTIF